MPKVDSKVDNFETLREDWKLFLRNEDAYIKELNDIKDSRNLDMINDKEDLLKSLRKAFDDYFIKTIYKNILTKNH